jgi:hypothetical protein
MAAASKPPKFDPRSRWPSLTPTDGILVADWPSRLVRFLLADGRTVDVLTARDDSDLRGALLEATGAEAIAGVVTLPAPAMLEDPNQPRLDLEDGDDG